MTCSSTACVTASGCIRSLGPPARVGAPLQPAGNRAPAPGGARANHRREGLPGREPRLAPIAARRRQRHAVLPVVDTARQPGGQRAGPSRGRRPRAGRPPPRRSRPARSRRPRRLPAAVRTRRPERRYRGATLDGRTDPVRGRRRASASHPRPAGLRQDDRALEGRRGQKRTARPVPHLVERPDAPRRGTFRVICPGRRRSRRPRFRDVRRRDLRGGRRPPGVGRQPRQVRRRHHPARSRHGRTVEEPARCAARRAARHPLRAGDTRRDRLPPRARRRASRRRCVPRSPRGPPRRRSEGGQGAAEGRPLPAGGRRAGGLSRARRRYGRHRPAAGRRPPGRLRRLRPHRRRRAPGPDTARNRGRRGAVPRDRTPARPCPPGC